MAEIIIANVYRKKNGQTRNQKSKKRKRTTDIKQDGEGFQKNQTTKINHK
jgi:hypothetical protein